MSTHRVLLLCSALGFVVVPSAAAASHHAKVAEPEDDSVDVTAARDKLRLFTDGHKHYLALVPFEFSSPMFFYGDGTDFYAQRGFGGSKNGDLSFSRSFWEPRVNAGVESMFQYRDKRYTLTCSTRDSVLTAVPQAESAKLLAAAHFHHPRWKYQSYWLARDERGLYYYVDRLREPPGNNSFRLFVGPKGDLKQQKMTNVVSDSKGDIFSTKSGELRLVSSASEGKWIVGKQKMELIVVPIEDNHVMLYTDLGVYTGQRLGTPCDDM